MTLVLPAQTLQDDCNRTGPELGISSSAVPYSAFDLIGSSNLLKILSNQLGATHPGESAVLTLDRGPDASLGAVIAALPEVGSRVSLVIRQHPSVSYAYGGYHLSVSRPDGSTWLWEIARRDTQSLPLTLGDGVEGPALEVGGWLGVQAEDDAIGGWYVAAADVTTDGSTVSFDTLDATLVLEREDATYADPGTYVILLEDTTARLDCITGSGTIVYPDPPTNSVLPALVGAAHTGNTLTVNPGTWVSVVDAYAYQWLRDGEEIVGATTSSYVLVEDDEETLISCAVTASNSGGEGDAETLARLCTRATFGQPWTHDGTAWVAVFAS